jgi:hypothetical protein
MAAARRAAPARAAEAIIFMPDPTTSLASGCSVMRLWWSVGAGPTLH